MLRTMNSTTFHQAQLIGGRIIAVGDTFTLPDGPTGEITEITEGVERNEAVWYVTVLTTLGTTFTDTVGRPGF